MFSSCTTFGTSAKGKRLETMQNSLNYDKENEIFKNQIETEQMIGSFWNVTWKFFTDDNTRRSPEIAPDIVSLNDQSFLGRPESGFRVTWLGHSTLMIEMEEKKILIDPVFSDRASPFQWVGPKRFHEVPITIEELPTLDAVVISHDHFDHLDHNSIEKLISKTKFFYVPLGIGAHLEGWGVSKEQIVEMDWYEEAYDGDLQFISTPARHFSGRSLTDRNETLWTSWVIKYKTHSVYYSGDTGPMPAFKEIGDKFGPFDITIIQLGAYGDQWPYIHLTPEEAIAAHKDLKGNAILPVHWGTFDLALHDWDDPIKRTIVAARKEKVNVLRPIPGEMIELKATVLDTEIPQILD